MGDEVIAVLMGMMVAGIGVYSFNRYGVLSVKEAPDMFTKYGLATGPITVTKMVLFAVLLLMFTKAVDSLIAAWPASAKSSCAGG